MTTNGAPVLYTCTLLTLLPSIWILIRLLKKMPPYPPGPKAFPIIGNVLDMPRRDFGRNFAKMRDIHGDVVYLNVLGQPILVLGTYKAAYELLDKRSVTLSGRPNSVMVEADMSWFFVFKNYGPKWRRYRRAFHQSFHADACVQHQSVQLEATRRMLCRILESSQDLSAILDFTFASTLMQLVYGLEVTRPDDRYFAMVERIREVSEDIAVPGRYLVEAIPFLRYLPAWLPGMQFKRYALKAKSDIHMILDSLHHASVKAKEEGCAQDTVATKILESSTSLEDLSHNETQTMCRGVSASAYIAGVETTNAVTHAFVLLMALHPEIQLRAQEELDAVVGQNRLPDFTDRPHLPFINALVKEVLRFHIVLPLGVPHRTTSGEVYNGYFIPEGTIVCPNVWAMSRDPDEYSDPLSFKPERFLDRVGESKFPERDPIDFAFGFGRRQVQLHSTYLICPGRHLADASLFITCASILHVYHIQPPIGEDGHRMKIEYEFSTESMLSHPKMYQFDIKPQSANAKRLILECMDAFLAKE
ncbi:cytochrome P450 [Dichomitus squalens LYAD-421 SS1]|uniref:cytochrome P450 n=1 Tax=Dichomitus squalens (strain LYAD-421) TaxID=732165 RepID=UPI00044122CF|nr:cytochrome P450 [Dichomitus squalens LYAD-421 SS1]EJF64334.1 cytochrome P450 [Dichomitus squalens LYAD-421 SS1]